MRESFFMEVSLHFSRKQKRMHIEVIVYDATAVFDENYDKRYGIPKDMLSSD